MAYRVACGLLAVGLGVLVYQLLTAPMFRVDLVEVRGDYLVPRQEIAHAAGVLGKNVFSVDRRSVASAVAGLGTLRRVEVAVALPNTVAVRVVEYEPRYVWQAAEDRYLVDERGIVLGAAPPSTPLPTLREVDGRPRVRGESVDVGALQVAARLVSLWPGQLGKEPLCEYGPGGLTVLSDEWRAELGDGSDLEAKLLVLAAIVEKVGVGDGRLSYVDLRHVDRPYYR